MRYTDFGSIQKKVTSQHTRLVYQFSFMWNETSADWSDVSAYESIELSQYVWMRGKLNILASVYSYGFDYLGITIVGEHKENSEIL